MKAQFCPNFSWIVWRHNRLGETEMTRLRCKSWQCEYCAQKNREMWRSHLKKSIGKLGGDWWFITITAHEWNRVKAATLGCLRTGLALLFKRMRRVWKEFDYVRVYELHEKSAFHAHLIISGLSPRVAHRRARSGERTFSPAFDKGKSVWSLKTWFKKTARSCKMGYMVDVQKLNSVAKTVNYICKYITKQAQAFDEPYLRRIETGGRIKAANSRKPAQGWVCDAYVWSSACAGGRVLVDLNLKLRINPTFWRENYTYPAAVKR